MNKFKNFQDFKNQVNAIIQPQEINGSFNDLGDSYQFEPETRKPYKNKRADFLHGMQIIYFIKDNIFEISEYQASERENELHIFKETNILKYAIKEVYKGNKRKPIKVWN
tara:strand:+ start:5707 stop:6036 length:330 start_codon:yes stop_codon:yes gene_type:complete